MSDSTASREHPFFQPSHRAVRPEIHNLGAPIDAKQYAGLIDQLRHARHLYEWSEEYRTVARRQQIARLEIEVGKWRAIKRMEAMEVKDRG